MFVVEAMKLTFSTVRTPHFPHLANTSLTSPVNMVGLCIKIHPDFIYANTDLLLILYCFNISKFLAEFNWIKD